MTDTNTFPSGLSSDMGWGNDSDESTGWGSTGSLLLLAAAGVYWVATSLVGGYPLAFFASRARRRRVDP